MAEGGGGSRPRRQLANEGPDPDLIAEHLRWLKGGGMRQYEKDFTDAPIALRYGNPYSPPRWDDVARCASRNRGNSKRKG